MNRRNFLSAASSAAALATLDFSLPGTSMAMGLQSAPQMTIGSAGASRGILAGSGIDVHHLRDDPKYNALVVQQCGIIVEINKFKFDATEPAPGQYNFTDTDYVMNFAQTITFRCALITWSGTMACPSGSTVMSLPRTRNKYWSAISRPLRAATLAASQLGRRQRSPGDEGWFTPADCATLRGIRCSGRDISTSPSALRGVQTLKRCFATTIMESKTIIQPRMQSARR